MRPTKSSTARPATASVRPNDLSTYCSSRLPNPESIAAADRELTDRRIAFGIHGEDPWNLEFKTINIDHFFGRNESIPSEAIQQSSPESRCTNQLQAPAICSDEPADLTLPLSPQVDVASDHKYVIPSPPKHDSEGLI